ncbi:unnamed protein product, partial [marine sediment metagenome]
MITAGAERVKLGVSLTKLQRYLTRSWPLYAMLIPGIVQVAIFQYYPMYGVVIAF